MGIFTKQCPVCNNKAGRLKTLGSFWRPTLHCPSCGVRLRRARVSELYFVFGMLLLFGMQSLHRLIGSDSTAYRVGVPVAFSTACGLVIWSFIKSRLVVVESTKK
jgi:hypothetical protein